MEPEPPNAFARLISNVVSGSKRRRLLLTPLAALIFFGLITLFVLAGLQVDKLLGLPSLTGLWRLTVSAACFALGLLIAGWSLAQFALKKGTPVPTSPPPGLITTGIYSRVRNPMIAGGFFLLEGIAFLLGSLSVIFVFAPLPVALYAFFIVTVEEVELELRFGQAYRDYKARVPRFVPRLRK
jgi:protein-S-isoprenylcysteine O-methyltransferase Ste14